MKATFSMFIDYVAWEIIRHVMYIQGMIYDYIMRFMNNDKDVMDCLQHSLSGYFLYRMKLEELPTPVRDKIRPFGRAMIFMFVFSAIYGFIKRSM